MWHDLLSKKDRERLELSYDGDAGHVSGLSERDNETLRIVCGDGCGGCPVECDIQRLRGVDRLTAAQEVIAEIELYVKTTPKWDIANSTAGSGLLYHADAWE